MDLNDTKQCSVSKVIIDDDPTMRAQTKWSNEDYRQNYGRKPPTIRLPSGQTKKREGGVLSGTVVEPIFLGDPAHRKKALKSRLYKVVNGRNADRHGMNQGDIIRVPNNYVYMINQIGSLDESEWENTAKAVLEHHYDNHEHCGDFCQRRKDLQDMEADIPTGRSKRHYRCKQEEPALHQLLNETIAPFLKDDKLLETAHGKSEARLRIQSNRQRK